MITVSVIVPVFKRVELLEECLVSFAASTRKPCEIIVVDDGNSPSDAARISDVCAKYSAKLVSLTKNSGAPAARNAGAKIATGDALFFADADISIKSDGLEALCRALENHEGASFAYGDFMFGKILMQAREFSVEALKKTNYISSMSLVRRVIFRPFDERLKRFQDWDLWLSLALRGASGVYVPQIIFTAQPGGSMSVWIPAIVIKYARVCMWVPRVRRYMTARAVILKKHSL